MAKGLASSYEALSATAVKQEIYDIFLNDPANPEERTHYFRDISTYGGCTAPMAAALESTRIIEDENLVENSREMGKVAATEAQMAQLMGNIMAEGVIVGRTNSSLPGLNTTLYFVPCLTVTEQEIDRMVTAVEKGLKKTF
jgi:taurine-pyruvate aminotransferase